MLARSRRLIVAAPLALAIGLAGCGSDAPAVTALPRTEVTAKLAEPAPAALSAEAKRLEGAAGTVLPGSGKEAETQLDAVLAKLKGTPVVVNLWGDWCVPCKKELPIFQRVALAQRGKIVFLGVATLSNRGKSEAYLQDKIALPYPSLLDDPGDLNRGTGIDSVPKTFFYDQGHKRYVHQGPYETEADLETDLRRYAG
ncbi:MAG: TlpA family protein disulfide reductase [Solirubrobacteraceae bacterium]|nr:TlpA family protein disulfide reductase [Solirubrobacteraceae bacterium]